MLCDWNIQNIANGARRETRKVFSRICRSLGFIKTLADAAAASDLFPQSSSRCRAKGLEAKGSDLMGEFFKSFSSANFITDYLK
jgi:hypothetical protein